MKALGIARMSGVEMARKNKAITKHKRLLLLAAQHEGRLVIYYACHNSYSHEY
jgi:hypothetical protein